MEILGLIYAEVTSCRYEECKHNNGGKCKLQRTQLYVTDAKMKAVCGNYEAVTELEG